MLSGKIVAGRLVRLAVQRHVDDLKHAGKRGFVFVKERANEAINFIETCCCHSKGKFQGKPFLLSGWQKFVIWCLFGWRRKDDGMRRFKRALIEIARKNGKSTLAAAIALLLLVFDYPVEAVAEIYSAATKEKQAKIVHDEAKRMVKKSKALRKRLRVLSNSIQYPATDGFFQPIGSDSDSTDGLNTHGVIGDELHAWQPRHRGLFEKLVTAGGSREQPLVLFITTAGEERSQLWIEEREYAVRVVESVISQEIVSDNFFAFVCALDTKRACSGCQKCDKRRRKPVVPGEICDGSAELPADDIFDESTWIKANPGLGVSVKIEYLRDQANEAQNKPTARNTFARYHCNLMTSASEKAIPPELWVRGSGKLSIEKGQLCHGAFDLGRRDDWAAIALCFPYTIDDAWCYDFITWSFTVQARDDELQTDQFQRWIDDGRLEEHWGDQVDFAAIRDKIVELSRQYHVVTWAYDPTFAEQMGQELVNDHGLDTFPFTQAAKHYNEPIRELLRALKRGDICHGDDPVLAWQAGNLCVRRNTRDEWMPDKVDSPGKIDAMVSSLMAFSECLFHQDEGKSIYEERGLRVL